MRLERITHGHRLREKLILGIIRLASGHPATDVVRTVYYRKELFGQPLLELTQKLMRGSSEWTVWERELFAAFISRINQCEF
jgi:hypothetical protein